MPSAKSILTSKNGAIFVQKDGPNTEVEYQGCHGLDTLSEPKGSKTLLHCFNTSGEYEVQGQTRTPPGVVTGTLTAPVKAPLTTMDELGENDCSFTLYVNLIACVDSQNRKLNNFAAFTRGLIAENMNIAQIDRVNWQHHRDDNEATKVYNLEGWPNIIEYSTLSIERQTTTEVNALNDIFTDDLGACASGCVTPHSPCRDVYIACDSAVGPATGNVLGTADSGTTWAALAADPFGAGLNVMAGVRFMINKDTERILVSQEAPAGAQGNLAYSDDNGATWTNVTIGGAAAGHGAVYGGGLYALDANHIWLASAAGYIYFSNDGGVTWTAQEQAGIVATDYYQVAFLDEYRGAAVTDAGVVVVTTNGGSTWTAATAITGVPNLHTVEIVAKDRIWVGDQAGDLWYTEDFGTTWSERTNWENGIVTADVRDIRRYNEHIIFLIANTAAPVGYVYRTVNGGTTWELYTTPANDGLNNLHVCGPNSAFAVGEVTGGTGVILKVAASTD